MRNVRTMQPSMIRMLTRAIRKAAVRCCRSSARRMERLAQMLDDLDDLVSMVGLAGERIRNAILSLMLTCTALAGQIGGVLLALIHPPLALAMALLLFVSLLYRLVTSPRLEIA